MTTTQALYYVDTVTTSKPPPTVKNIFALNFANAGHAGGGVARGKIAQEETICLQGDQLYKSLNTISYVKWKEPNWFKKYFKVRVIPKSLTK